MIITALKLWLILNELFVIVAMEYAIAVSTED